MLISASQYCGVDTLLAALRSAAEPTRLRLLALLSHGEATVSELCRMLGQSQPRVSRHLKLLTDGGLVARIPEGSWVFYRLADTPLAKSIFQKVLQHIDPTDARLRSDTERLQAVREQRTASAQLYFRSAADNWRAIRSLHVHEAEVEREIQGALGDASFTSLLDIGTGTGRMLQLLGPRVDAALGVDTSHDMLRIARESLEQSVLPHVQARYGDMYCLASPSQAHDLVLIHQVLHYADDPLAVIAEAARVLQTGGQLLIVDFAPHELEELRDSHQHRRLGFADQEVLAWTSQCGLEGRVVSRLPGQALTVVLWLCSNPRPRRPQCHRKNLRQTDVQNHYGPI
ncbi:MAG: metalloregulator ArsR/SmtB family transcription factor [Gemmatimonadota bacterium]|nr:metalloregulator ArsR/SmtB family transcription factor [Gemmatimonadota bacterium]